VRILADQLGLTDAEHAAMVAAAHGGTPSAPARTSSPAARPDGKDQDGKGPDSSMPIAGHWSEATASPPAQLPADVFAFTGRVDELAALDRLLTRAGPDEASGDPPGTPMVVVVLTGTGGVGKTALAVHWAHRAAAHFPDGQLYVNLRGFDPNAPAARPSNVLRTFLSTLGMAPDQIPYGLDGQIGLYRSRLAGRRMLLVLDNARDAEQVRPLMPGSDDCSVLITSRDHLTSLVAVEGARPVHLGPLSPGEGRQLLASRIGAERTAAEPEAVDEMATSCDGLPLALVIVAAHAAIRPGFALKTLASDLWRANGRQLGPLDGGDARSDLQAVFSWSYRTLSPQAARLFRLLGEHPGPDVGTGAAATLADVPLDRARSLLGELTRACLLEERRPSRYACHDLLRMYAADLCLKLDPEVERKVALRRVIHYYLQTTAAADRLLDAHRDPIELLPLHLSIAPPRFASRSAAMEWLTAEEQVLVAAVTSAANAGLHREVWQLAWALVTYLDETGHWQEWVATHRAAVTAAAQAGDRAGLAHSYRGLGRAEVRLGDDAQALIHYQQALDLYGELSDQTAQAHTHLNLGRVYERAGRHRQALAHAEQVLALFEAAGHRVGRARALNNLGWINIQLGEHSKAIEYCTAALALHQELGNRRGQCAAWDSLGCAHHHLSQYQRAISCFNQTLSLLREGGDQALKAETLTHRGDSYYAAGDLAAAQQSWQQALLLLETTKIHTGVEEVRGRISTVRPRSPAAPEHHGPGGAAVDQSGREEAASDEEPGPP
jgi:tetratricopeptide (TPR) repeat protein